MTDENVWTVGARAKVYHKTRECIEKHRVEDGGVLVVEPRQTTVEKAKRRDLRECEQCFGDFDRSDQPGGGISILERKLREQGADD